MYIMIWKNEGRVTIKKAGENLCECQFNNLKALDLRWGLLLFEEMKGGERYSRMKFRYASLWIHFLDLPRVCLNRKWVEALGRLIWMRWKGREETL